MDAILAGVDMTAVGTWVGGVGLLIVAASMAFKGIDLAKRAIRKA